MKRTKPFQVADWIKWTDRSGSEHIHGLVLKVTTETDRIGACWTYSVLHLNPGRMFGKVTHWREDCDDLKESFTLLAGTS